ncbi:ABC transporter ATP-binding protein [Allostella vacuolata]|nr:ABC transporter ATP-binding protein [Stella vacuolata]
MAEPTPILDIQGLSVALPSNADRKHAVGDLSLQLFPNEIVCVVGESGSGKSVMARAILGLLPVPRVRPVAGRILLEGEDLLAVPPARLRAIRGQRISMVFQEPMTALNPVMTIGDQIDEVVATHLPLPERERRQRILELFAAVKLPDPERIRHAYPHQLSGGQRQRAMIAMALVLGPPVLIADEPTTALDVTTQAQVLTLIKEMQGLRQTGVLFITHDFGVVAEIADRVAVMQRGRIVEQGPAADVLNRPQHPYTRALIGAVPKLEPPPRPAPSSKVPFLEVRGLDKAFRSGGGIFSRGRVVHAARNVSFQLRRGETLGLVGESGSGKSTVARCVIRLVDPDGGDILIGGEDIAHLGRRALRPWRQRIQMVFQDPFASLNPRRPVGRQIADGPMTHGVTAEAAMARARSLLELVGLEPKAADRYPHEFSGGQRQRIGIARALAMDPEILVADEPVSALDVSVQAQVLELLADIRRRFGLTMLFITHDLRVAAQVCDTIAVMRQGEIVESGPTAEIFARPSHPYTQTLLASVPGRAWTPPAFADAPVAAAV